MYSIRLRLTLFFIIATTVILGAFGVFSQVQLSRELEERFAQLQHGVSHRLQVNLPAALWGFELPTVERIIRAELIPQEVRAIYVLDVQQQIVFGLIRSASGDVVRSSTEQQAQGLPLASPVYSPGVLDPVSAANQKLAPLGQVRVYFSREHIHQALRDGLIAHALEILLVDLLLVLVLTLGLRMLFNPLARLRDAQFELARQDSEHMQELPPTRRTELDELTNGFNATLRKLKQVILHRTQAEEAARAAANATREALDELKSAQEELVKAGQMAGLGSLVAGIAHELNTPIGNGMMAVSTLQGNTNDFLQRISDRGISRKALEQYLDSVLAASDIAFKSLERSAKLVSSFKQIAVDQTTSQRATFLLHLLVIDVLTILQPTLKRTPYRIDMSVPVDISMDSYPGPLEQVLTNLITNAVFHGFDGREHGSIDIKADLLGQGHVLIRVRDDGKGITPTNLPKIFDPFFTTKLGKGGSGLGLHIAHNLVTRLLGGTLKVHSQLGTGSEFELDLPCKAPKTKKA